MGWQLGAEWLNACVSPSSIRWVKRMFKNRWFVRWPDEELCTHSAMQPTLATSVQDSESFWSLHLTLLRRIVRSDYVCVWRWKPHTRKNPFVSWKSVVYYYFPFYEVNRKNFAFNPYSIHTIWRRVGDSVCAVCHINLMEIGKRTVNTWIHFIVDNVQVSHAIGRCALVSSVVHSHNIEFEQWPLITLMLCHDTSTRKRRSTMFAHSHAYAHHTKDLFMYRFPDPRCTCLTGACNRKYLYLGRASRGSPNIILLDAYFGHKFLSLIREHWTADLSICKWCAIDMSPERRR